VQRDIFLLGIFSFPGIREMPRPGIFIPSALYFVRDVSRPGFLSASTRLGECSARKAYLAHPRNNLFYNLIFTTKQSTFHLVRTGRINFPLLPAARSLLFPTAHHYTTKMESKVVHKMVIVGSGMPPSTILFIYL
jgi:hypothetical protein